MQMQQFGDTSSPRHPATCGYLLLNAIFSSLIFVAVYFFYILQTPRDILQFFYVFVLTIVSGMIGSVLARMITMYWDGMLKTLQFHTKTLIAALLYTVIVFFGLYGYITDRYIDFTTVSVADFLVYMFTRPFFEIVLILLVIKLIVYLISDFLADKVTFGGG
jgi:uncharacterized membrane protein YeaQ/YmgE (transglycosylase-associated protein family)